MPEFVNNNAFSVHLTGPSGENVIVKPHQRVLLSDFYEKYCSRGFIRRVPSVGGKPPSNGNPIIQARIRTQKPQQPKSVKPQPQHLLTPPKVKKNIREVALQARKHQPLKPRPAPALVRSQTVGKNSHIDPNKLLLSNIDKSNYPISNGVAVGILSYNRANSLRRLVDSIIRYTDLRKTTVFISDDASTDQDTINYLTELSNNYNIVIIRNDKRIGVAGNSNRLLRCLSRFSNCILLNDDVEVLDYGWEHFYFESMKNTGFHHYIYRQVGVYDADVGDEVSVNGIKLTKVDSKPHGAVLAFTNTYLDVVGFFDESYGIYGMEHVDWSQKAWEFNLQSVGFYDVVGSSSFFKVHSETSAVVDRSIHFKHAKSVFNNRPIVKISSTPDSIVPSVAYVIPIRNFERTDSIRTVIDNIRAQRFPSIEIILVEQDNSKKIDTDILNPIRYYLVNASNSLFNKSKAFNYGVSMATAKHVILHDADMLAPGHYTSSIMDILKTYDACHVGNTVIYTSQNAMNYINSNRVVDENSKCERVVGYYEGGSIACSVEAFWRSGGFNEDFWGYGCEDCDFYARLSHSSNWNENRIFDFLHLWHSRVPGWDSHHTTNKEIESKLKSLDMQVRISDQYEQLSENGYGDILSSVLETK